jgi:hypothetical protein
MEKFTLPDEYLCRDLRLTIRKGPHPIDKTLCEVTISLTGATGTVEVCYPINNPDKGSWDSWKYHVREAVIVGTRRILGEAWKAGLIKDGTSSHALGESTGLNIDLGPE